jgi:hypothetical protein
MINGMPQPALVRFTLHETPHFIDLCRLDPAGLYRDRGRTASFHDAFVDWGARAGPFFNSLITVLGLTCSTRANSAHATAIERHLDHLPPDLGQTPGRRIGPKKGAPAQARLLTAIPGRPVTGRAVLHDCLTVAVQTPNRFLCHRPSSVLGSGPSVFALLRGL